MPDAPSGESTLLVLVDPDAPLDPLLERAVAAARDWRADSQAPVSLAVRVVAAGDEDADAAAREVADALSTRDLPEAVRTNSETLTVAGATPGRRTDALLEALDLDAVARVLVSANTRFAVDRLRAAFGATAVELVPDGEALPRRRLVHPGSARRLATVFALTYLFYLALGGFAGGLDYLTGAVSAGVVTLALSRVALRDEPSVRQTVPRVLRTIAFLPVLGWEVAKANVGLAAVILHPRLPIDPSVDAVETAVRTGMEQMVLANSISLTPGSLVLDVDEETFTVHSLTAGAKRGLEAGRLQALVAWVFHGRNRTTASEEGD